jgi:hypothetical protein
MQVEEVDFQINRLDLSAESWVHVGSGGFMALGNWLRHVPLDGAEMEVLILQRHLPLPTVGEYSMSQFPTERNVCVRWGAISRRARRAHVRIQRRRAMQGTSFSLVCTGYEVRQIISIRAFHWKGRAEAFVTGLP